MEPFSAAAVSENSTAASINKNKSTEILFNPNTSLIKVFYLLASIQPDKKQRSPVNVNKYKYCLERISKA
jgi:hypothetical protein